MEPTDDSALLRQYAENNSDEAFAALVTRHINLVYSVALRQVGNTHNAEEITQAVFIILAKKAASLRHENALSSWLFQATRLTANNFIRSEARRHRREEEACMQSILNESETEVWPKIAPLLDSAVAGLREKDRRAILLRFYEGWNLREVGQALGASEDAAEKRVNRALEKLRKFFTKRGVSSTTAIIAGAMSAHSVQAAPVTLAKSVTAVAIAKGAAASASTLILINGALKIMAWAKAKTAIVVGTIVILVAGTTTVAVKWDTGKIDPQILDKSPPIVQIIPSQFPNNNGWAGSGYKMLGVANQLKYIVEWAYGVGDTRTIFLTMLPQNKYDFISNVDSPHDALKQQIKKQFGIVGRTETIETNVLFLRVKQPNAPGLIKDTTNKSSSSSENLVSLKLVNQPEYQIAAYAEIILETPVIDQTGLNGRFDIDLKWNETNRKESFKQVFADQLGLELVPGTAPIEMLIVEKAQ